MKLTIKNLKQIPHEVEVAGSEASVLDLKIAIESSHGFDHKSLKLLFNGVVLDDAKHLVDYNVQEGNVLIMMNTKAKPVNIPKEEPKHEEKHQTNQTQVTNPSNCSTSSHPQQNVPKPKDYSKAIQTLVEMGFPQPESEAAVKAARGNVDLAVEFLYNGIPDNLPGEQISQNEPQTRSNELKKIAGIIKILVSQNPSALQNILLGIQQNDPQLMDLIKSNEEEFKNLLQQPITESDLESFQAFQNQARGLAQEGGINGSPQQGRDNTIALSKQDYDAVNRLKELGFNEMDALQAYFACDKNEEMAANLLWDNKTRELDIDYSQVGYQQNEGQNPNANEGDNSKDQNKDDGKDKEK